jgi:hypothetical protein
MIRVILMEVLPRKFDIGYEIFAVSEGYVFCCILCNNGVEAMEEWACQYASYLPLVWFVFECNNYDLRKQKSPSSRELLRCGFF